MPRRQCQGHAARARPDRRQMAVGRRQHTVDRRDHHQGRANAEGLSQRHEIVFGDGSSAGRGLAAGLKPGALHLSMSTLSPGLSSTIAAEHAIRSSGKPWETRSSRHVADGHRRRWRGAERGLGARRDRRSVVCNANHPARRALSLRRAAKGQRRQNRPCRFMSWHGTGTP